MPRQADQIDPQAFGQADVTERLDSRAGAPSLHRACICHEHRPECTCESPAKDTVVASALKAGRAC